MQWLLKLLAIYCVGFVLVCIVAHFAARTERTAHGQDVIRQMGCLTALLWPFAIAYFSVVLPIVGVALLARAIKEWRV
tara:strand:+ start:624 stop:857 length:234 start_codon:yes stop_codon:yes gene_type:complete